MQREEVKKNLEEQYISVCKTEDEFHKDIYGKAVENTYQRRELLKHISLISMAILGLSPLVLDKLVYEYETFFKIGIIMHLFLVFFIISRLREILDKDSSDLQLIENSKGEIFEERKSIIEECKRKELSIAEYTEKIKDSRGYKKIIKEIEDGKNQGSDYCFEFIVFIFTTATFFILIALLNFNFDMYWIVISILLFFVMSFSYFSTLIIKILSKLSKPIVFPKKQIK